METWWCTREEILAPTAPRICSACPTCLEECDPQEGPGHPLQSQAERNLLCRERATYLHSKQVAADGKSVRYGSVINCCNCRLYLAQGAGAGGPGHSSSMQKPKVLGLSRAGAGFHPSTVPLMLPACGYGTGCCLTCCCCCSAATPSPFYLSFVAVIRMDG